MGFPVQVTIVKATLEHPDVEPEMQLVVHYKLCVDDEEWSCILKLLERTIEFQLRVI